MSSYLEQYERLKRYWNKINDQNRSQVEYEDDLWAFFQHCWHLKDWIKNDPNLNIPINIETYINQHCPYLMICADLCNRSKHLKLTSSRRDANITNIGVTIHAPLIGSGEIGSVEYEYTVTLDDGTKYNTLIIAKEALDEWDNFIAHMI